jgi:hypothetical protein
VILSALLIVLLAVPLLLIAAQGVGALARLFGLVSPAETHTRAEFARISFEAPVPATGAPSVALAQPVPEPQKRVVEQAWRACTTCGEAVTTRAAICRHCGAQLDADD